MKAEKLIHYYDINSDRKEVKLEADQLFFTVCQVPVIYELGLKESLEIITNESSHKQENLTLTTNDSSDIFKRTGKIVRIKVTVNAENLR